MTSITDNLNNHKKECEEHIMVCLSSSPSNAKIIATAEKMALAFGGKLTALYVKTKSSDFMSDEDKARLSYHIKIAEQAGASVTTVYSEDVPYQIAEYARISGVTKLVIGRSAIDHKHIWGKTNLTEKLIEIAPNLDIHIIPDSFNEKKYKEQKKKFAYDILPTTADLLISIFIVVTATAIAYLCWQFEVTQGNIIAVYILGVFITSVMTKSYGCSIMNSFASVLLFNFLFIDPLFSLRAKDIGYFVTFAIMLIVSLLTAALTDKLKRHAKESAQAAYRTRILLDTNQLLQKEKDDFEIIQISAGQLLKLLDRNIVFYIVENGILGKPYVCDVNPEVKTDFFLSDKEREAAEWVLQNQKRAGAGTDIFHDAKGLYFAIRINHMVFGVIGIQVGMDPLDSFENNIILSILGECALAIANNRNAKEKEAAAVMVKNEQLRANLLRSISHDFRTPLTTISGNADALITNSDKIGPDVQKQMLTDIYEDSMWLNDLVENLLSITRIEEGRMNLHISAELVEEVIQEALHHVNRKCKEHTITVSVEKELMLAKMDSRLIVQVIINLVDNAIKYTTVGSTIEISAKEKKDMVCISIADNGSGIAEEIKPHVFDMFFTGKNKIVDSRRSLGLGLALCKSIITAHGGKIELKDNEPHGSIFTFTLPKEEVKLYE